MDHVYNNVFLLDVYSFSLVAVFVFLYLSAKGCTGNRTDRWNISLSGRFCGIFPKWKGCKFQDQNVWDSAKYGKMLQVSVYPLGISSHLNRGLSRARTNIQNGALYNNSLWLSWLYILDISGSPRLSTVERFSDEIY